MIKRVAVYWIPEGTDGDKFWEYHTKVHAADAVRYWPVKPLKYTITRITQPIMGEKAPFFALVEMWWENEEVMTKSMNVLKTTKLPNGKFVMDDFWSRVAGGFIGAAEEYEVV